MLCSHKKRFIYFKTRKTAGTSVEIFFEKHCVPESYSMESHDVKEIITEVGIVGSRMGGRSSSDTFTNHMSAVDIRSKLGSDIFDSYYKFCVVRNPYDKCVSRFWWNLRNRPLKRRLLELAPFGVVKHYFKKFILSKADGLADDRHIYMIGADAVMDKFIQFENLQSDIKDVCSTLGIDFVPASLGTYKSGYRNRQEHFSEYYDPETQRIIEQKFSWEIGRFGYSLNTPNPSRKSG